MAQLIKWVSLQARAPVWSTEQNTESGMMGCAYNPRYGEPETGRSLELTGQPSKPDSLRNFLRDSTQKL